MLDVSALQNLDPSTEPLHKYRTYQYLAREGEEQRRVHKILEGWALRYKLLPDGRRQISAVFLPGDCCDILWITHQRAASHVMAVTLVTTTSLAVNTLQARRRTDPAFEDWLWNEAALMSEIQAEWIVSLGRMRAIEKLGHLMCELFLRLKAVGRTNGDRCWMPLTQVEIGDLTGLTPVHVNRTLQEMRAAGLLELHAKWLRIPDLNKLRKMSLVYDEYVRMLSRPKLRDAWRHPATSNGGLRPVEAFDTVRC